MKIPDQLTHALQVRLQSFMDKEPEQLNEYEMAAQNFLAKPLRDASANMHSLMDMTRSINMIMSYENFQQTLDCLPDRAAAMELLTQSPLLSAYRFANDKAELKEVTQFVSDFFTSKDALSFFDKVDPRAFLLNSIENFNSADIIIPTLSRTDNPVGPINSIINRMNSANTLSGFIQSIIALHSNPEKTQWNNLSADKELRPTLGQLIDWVNRAITAYADNIDARGEDRHTFNLNPLIEYVMASEPTTEETEKLIDLIENTAQRFPERDFERQFMLSVLDGPDVTDLYRMLNDDMEEHYLSVPHREASDEYYNKVNLEIELPYAIHRDRALSVMRDIHYANPDNGSLEIIRKAIVVNDNIRVGLSTYLTYFGESLGSDQLTAVRDLEGEGRNKPVSQTLMKLLKRESESLVIQTAPNSMNDEFKNMLPQWTAFYREKLGLDTDESISPR